MLGGRENAGKLAVEWDAEQLQKYSESERGENLIGES